MSALRVFTEYECLREVVVGFADTLPPLTPINAIQAHYYSTDPPKIEKLVTEHAHLVSALQDNGVRVVWATDVPECDQRDIRDIAAVVGTKMLICRVKEDIRKCEVGGLEQLVGSLAPTEVIWCTEGFLEGGDIVLDGTRLLVGIGKRTNLAGFEFVRAKFSDQFDVVPLSLLGDHALHLDTVFSIVSDGLAVAYPSAIDEQSRIFLSRRYHLIEITEDEQFRLAANILAINPHKVIVDVTRNARVAVELANCGLEVVDIGFSETNKIGGSFRCATLPLRRAG